MLLLVTLILSKNSCSICAIVQSRQSAAATEVPIEGNLLISYPTAKQVVHVRYPGPSVSGGAPAKVADKHGAGTRRPACRKRPSHLKGTVNQWETAEARASPLGWQTPTFQPSDGTFGVCVCTLPDLHPCMALVFKSPDFAYGCRRDARRVGDGVSRRAAERVSFKE